MTSLSLRISKIENAAGTSGAAEPFRYNPAWTLEDNSQARALHEFFSGLGAGGVTVLLDRVARDGRRLVDRMAPGR